MSRSTTSILARFRILGVHGFDHVGEKLPHNSKETKANNLGLALLHERLRLIFPR